MECLGYYLAAWSKFTTHRNHGTSDVGVFTPARVQRFFQMNAPVAASQSLTVMKDPTGRRVHRPLLGVVNLTPHGPLELDTPWPPWNAYTVHTKFERIL